MAGPSPWLLECGDLIPRNGRALEVACGRGRNALLLASAGLHVTAVDRDAHALARLQDQADRLGLPVTTRVVDLETRTGWLARARPRPVTSKGIVPSWSGTRMTWSS